MDHPPSPPPAPAETHTRLALYRRAARALNRFYRDWTAPFCAHCLAVTAHAHPEDPRCAVALIRGQFPGCCQAGVGDELAVPGHGPAGRFPPELASALQRARGDEQSPTVPPPAYSLQETHSGRQVHGVGCRHLGPTGCALADLKAPLCLTYVCSGVRDALASVGGIAIGSESDDNFSGSADTLAAVVGWSLHRAQRCVAELEATLDAWQRQLRCQGMATGEDLLQHWLGTQAAST